MTRDYAHPYYYVKDHKKPKRRIYRLLAVIILIIVTASTILVSNSKKEDTKTVASARTQALPTSLSETQQNSKLKEIIATSLQGTKGTYAVAIINLKTDEYYMQNEQRVYKSASLYKLWVMATIFEQIKEGKISPSTKVSEDMDVLYNTFNLGSPSAITRLTYSVDQALEKMITVSDNDAALLLAQRARLSNIKTLLESNSFTGSRLGTATTEPVTTAYDTATFLYKLYKGEIIDKTYSDKMLALLKRQRLNEKLPKYLPAGTVIAHKTGELDEYSHDAGIVYSPNGDYVIVVLSQSSTASKKQADERIAELSKAVYEYFASS